MFGRRSYDRNFETMGEEAVRHALDRGRIAEPEATHARIWLHQLRRARGVSPTAAQDPRAGGSSAVNGESAGLARAQSGTTGDTSRLAIEANALARRAIAEARRARTIAFLAMAVAIASTVVLALVSVVQDSGMHAS
ncbi:MAG TPA: hypothetical protein VI168_11400 [Croceibacterium sp.]